VKVVGFFLTVERFLISFVIEFALKSKTEKKHKAQHNCKNDTYEVLA
jgi:hypothetical protein